MFKVIRIPLFVVVVGATVVTGILWPFLWPFLGLDSSAVRLENAAAQVDCTASACTCRVPFTAFLSSKTQARLTRKQVKVVLKGTFRVNGKRVDDCSASDNFPISGATVSGVLSCASSAAGAETLTVKNQALRDAIIETGCQTDLRATLDVLSELAAAANKAPISPPANHPAPPVNEGPAQEKKGDAGGCTRMRGDGESGLSFPPGVPTWTVSTTAARQQSSTLIGWGVSYRNPKIGRTASTGSVRVSLWALPAPYAGASSTGYKIATANPNFYGDGAASPNQLYNYSSAQLSSRVVGRNPPPGTYCMVLMLEQYDSVHCSTADHYCLADWQQSRWQAFW